MAVPFDDDCRGEPAAYAFPRQWELRASIIRRLDDLDETELDALWQTTERLATSKRRSAGK